MPRIHQRADQRQVRELAQLMLQLTLLGIGLDGAAKAHAALILELATATGFEVDPGFTALGHVLFCRKKTGNIGMTVAD